MERKLHLLDSFDTRADDGSNWRVYGYEHLVRDPTAADAVDRWEATGVTEYKLADGRHLDETADGSFSLPGTQMRLRR